MKVKMTPFDHLKNLHTKKKNWDDFNDEEKKIFNVFIINKALSFNPNYIDIVNLIQKYSAGQITPKEVFKIYFNLLPSKFRFYKWIKGKKEKENKKPTVFLVQENPYINVLSAQEYGDIVLLFESGQQIMFSPQPAIKKLRRKLKDFDDNDYLLMMGDPAAMGIACCIASDMNRGRFKILKWDKIQKKYYSVSININEKGEIDEQDKL